MNDEPLYIIPTGKEEIDKSLSIALRNFDYKTGRIANLYEQLKLSPSLEEDDKILLEFLNSVSGLYLEIENCEEKLKVKDFPKYRDWNGEKIHRWEWVVKMMLFPKHDGVDIINGYRISTVWLGIDFGFIPSPKPLIFETKIFKEKEIEEEDKWDGTYMDRYFSYEEALEGHKKACEYVKQVYSER